MYIDYSTWETFEYKVSTLQLDVNNPRIRYNKNNLNQAEILKLLIQKEKIYELAKKISEEGYFVCEEPIICIENGKKVVLEGNRRIAALKLLQDPKKYLNTARANVLLKNTLANNIHYDKIRCYIAPNRLQANPIIYERHKGDAVKRWETGNQYSFVAEMYSKDGLSIEDICKVLNENRSEVMKTIKTYNLFIEGQKILDKEGLHIDTDNFNLTNLERFYSVDTAKQFLGIDFDNDSGEIKVKLPDEEYEKRMLVAFDKLSNSDNFSRTYNTNEDIQKLVKEMSESPNIDMSIELSEGSVRNSMTNRQELESAKSNITKRRNSKRKQIENSIISRDREISFNNEKLDALFTELKTLPIDKKYAFSVLLRTYLEQALFYYLDVNDLLEDFSKKQNEESQKNGLAKVKSLLSYLKGKNHNTICAEEDDIMKILKFNVDKKDYSNVSLKPMLDYVMSKSLVNEFDNQTYKVIKQQVEMIKTSLDLSVHNIKYFADFESTKKAWSELEPIIVFLSNNINVDK